jgi:hypothetical protein
MAPMRKWLIGGLALAASCYGPPAPDAAVCDDFIHRICLTPICGAVIDALSPGSDCEDSLLQRSGCASPDFAFTTPSRDEFLSCRLPLLRSGSSRDSVPNCDDVDDIFTNCPDVVAFLNGAGPDGGP